MDEVTATPGLAQSELTPDDVSVILGDLQGFGITDTEQLLTLTVAGRTINLRFANLSTEDEVQSLMANAEVKGHAWVHQMRCELLSRAVTWINGVTVHDGLYAKDPQLLEDRPIRAILRDMFIRWGQQVALVLFKVYMVHCQRIEDNLIEQLPDALIMTQVEARFMQQIADELKATGVQALVDAVEEAVADTSVPDKPTE